LSVNSLREIQAHETAHFFDRKFGLKQRFYKRGESKAMAEEMLAHMERMGESDNRMKKTEERFADSFEWWLTHRDLAKRDLPLFSKEMDKIISEIPELKPILKIEPKAGFSIESMEETMFARQKFTTDPQILPLRVKGEQKYLKINDPLLASALRGTNRSKVDPSLRAVAAFTRLYAGLMTRFNPEFSMPNKIRDLQETAVYLMSQKNLGIKAAAKTVARDTASILDVTNAVMGRDTAGARLYNQMKMDGGTTGGMALSTRKQLEINIEAIRKTNRSLTKQAAQALFQSVDAWNTIFEDSTRLSVYKTALESGLSRKEAAVKAKEASLNFNKLGTWSPIVNALYMFSNASVQGSAKMLRAMRNPKTALLVATMMTAAIAIIAEYNDKIDKDWRKKVSKWDKLNGITVMLKTQSGIKYITIPISWGLKPLKVGLEALLDLGTDKDKDMLKAVGDVMTAVIEGYNPAGGTDIVSAMMPTILDLPLDIARNRSWTGGKIRPDWNQSAPASVKYFDRLKDKVAGKVFIDATKSLSENGIEISPADANYAFENLIGGAGRFVTKSFNTISGKGGVREYPFVSRFYRDIPEEEIRASDKNIQPLFDALKKQSKARFYENQEAELIYEGMKNIPPAVANAHYKEIKRTDPKLAEQVREIAKDEKLSYTDRLIKKLGVENGERAKYIWSEVKKMDTGQNKYIKDLRDKKIISDRVFNQIKILKRKGY
jgi:hypothetical protein